MEYKNLDMPSLIEKCAGRDLIAWAEFVKRFSPFIGFSIKKALLKYTGSAPSTSEDINDIRQEIMAGLWDKNRLAEVKNRENINYWLAIVARNAAINHIRKRRQEVLMTDEEFFDKLPAKCESESACSDEALHKDTTEFYGRLSPKEKLIFKLHFKKGLALKDASAIMRIPEGTISSIVTRMRKKFRK